MPLQEAMLVACVRGSLPVTSIRQQAFVDSESSLQPLNCLISHDRYTHSLESQDIAQFSMKAVFCYNNPRAL